MIYKRIKNLRVDHDLTQAAIAKIIGCCQNTYSDYELGKINIPLDIMIKLADYYDVSVDYLTERTNYKKVFKK